MVTLQKAFTSRTCRRCLFLEVLPLKAASRAVIICSVVERDGLDYKRCMDNEAFINRMENLVAGILEGLSDFYKQMESRMDKLEQEVRLIRIEAAEDRAKMSRVQVALRKTSNELAKV